MTALLEIRGVSKSFGRIAALSNVSFDVHVSTVHAVLGENGAGKSTLMNVLYGLLEPDEGELRLSGRSYAPRSPRDAIASGVGMVHQHFELAPSLTAAENLFLAEGSAASSFRYRRAAAESRLRALSARHRLDVDPGARVSDLAVGVKQRLEILKALANEARLLVLDEPTAVLTPHESRELLGIARAQANDGRAVLFVTHRLAEVAAVADRVTLLRRGEVVETLENRDLDPARLAELVIGGRMEEEPPDASSREEVLGPPTLEIHDLVAREPAGAGIDGVRLTVRGGEVVAIAGVDGNGQDALVRAVAGILEPESGHVRVDGRLGVIPGDRRLEGLVGEMSVRENLILKRHDDERFVRAGFRRLAKEREFSEDAIRRFSIVTRGPDEPVARLSGGNQQKVVLARELSLEPAALLAVNPTRGLDVRSTREMHAQLRALRDRGAAILLVSSDLDEAIALADRILVLYRGRLTEAPKGADRETIGLLLLSGKADS